MFQISHHTQLSKKFLKLECSVLSHHPNSSSSPSLLQSRIRMAKLHKQLGSGLCFSYPESLGWVQAWVPPTCWIWYSTGRPMGHGCSYRLPWSCFLTMLSSQLWSSVWGTICNVKTQHILHVLQFQCSRWKGNHLHITPHFPTGAFIPLELLCVFSFSSNKLAEFEIISPSYSLSQFPHLVALLSRETFLEKARSEMRNSLPEAHTDILLLLCNLPRKRRENYRPGIEKLLSDACCSIIICCKRD